MPDFTIAPAWSALFLGLFSLFAGIAELRVPGKWHRMMEEISTSPSVQMLTALVELFLGGEHVTDADQLDRLARSWAFAGFRLIGK